MSDALQKYIRVRRFWSKKSFNSLKQKLHPNQIIREYTFISDGRTGYGLKYLTDTKATRRKFKLNQKK